MDVYIQLQCNELGGGNPSTKAVNYDDDITRQQLFINKEHITRIITIAKVLFTIHVLYFHKQYLHNLDLRMIPSSSSIFQVL